jgi:hypothetical protein
MFMPSAFPLTITRIYLVAASNNAMDAGMQFDLELYQETGQPTPGPRIGAPINLSIAGSQSAATVVDFALLGLPAPTIPNPGRFRICFRKQFDQMHNICLDDASPPSAYGRNWAHVRIAADPGNPCGSAITGNEWYSADGTGSIFPGFPGIQGDFIVRPDLLAADPTGLPGGGGTCPIEDAGVAPDADEPPEDAGELAEAGEPDAEPGEDAIAKDAGEDAGEDAGMVEPDAGPSRPPEIIAISPDSGRSDSPTNVTITGRSFASGLTVKIGAISASDVAVGGSTTITAIVPQGIAAGIYDVVVTNPDMQAAILADGFTVQGQQVVNPPRAEGCGCAAQRSGGAPWLAICCLLMMWARAKRRG